jgi:hypothetical protein
MHVVAFDCCFSVSPFGTFQAFTIDFGHWGRTDDLNFTYFLFSMLHTVGSRQIKSSKLFVKLRSDLRIHPGTLANSLTGAIISYIACLGTGENHSEGQKC